MIKLIFIKIGEYPKDKEKTESTRLVTRAIP